VENRLFLLFNISRKRCHQKASVRWSSKFAVILLNILPPIMVCCHTTSWNLPWSLLKTMADGLYACISILSIYLIKETIAPSLFNSHMCDYVFIMLLYLFIVLYCSLVWLSYISNSYIHVYMWSCFCLRCLASVTLDLRLPSRPPEIAGTKLYCLWQRHVCVNNLPVVASNEMVGSRTCKSQASALTVTPPGHTCPL